MEGATGRRAGQGSWVNCQSTVSLNRPSMCRYFASVLGRKKVRSFQLRMRGISLIPSRNERAWTGVDWPCVSACTVVGWMSEVFLIKTLKDVDRLPDPARDEVAEQGDVRVRDVVVGNPAVAAIADRVFGEHAVLGQLVLGPIRCG